MQDNAKIRDELMPGFCNREAPENRGTAVELRDPAIPKFPAGIAANDRRNANGKAERVARSSFAEYYPDQEFNPTPYLLSAPMDAAPPPSPAPTWIC